MISLHTKRRLHRLIRQAHGLIKDEKLEEAWPYITEILTLNFDDSRGLYLCGVFMRKKGHSGVACNFFRRACALEPKNDNIWLHFAACLHDIHQHEAAMQIWNLLLKHKPTDPQFLRNKAGTLLQQGKFHDALNTINQAIELVEDPPPLAYRAIKGMSALALERWQEGFENYSGLHGDQIVTRKYCTPEEPEWDGSPGKTVVIQGDQGIGDEIRFASVLEEAAKDVNIIYDCHPKLQGVMQRSFPQIQCYGTRKHTVAPWLEGKKIDASHHISSLGKYYRKRDSDFPRKPFLIPDDEKRKYWREVLKDLPRPLVGIAWTGGHHFTMREHRSFDIATFMPIIQEGGSFIDLSYHDSQAEIDYFNERSEHKVLKFDVDQSDYDNTLALVAELDLVICVPTTILHAAGAIGKQCFVFNPSYPYWEFGNRDDMIWYNSVKVFRGQIEDVRDAYLHWCGQAATAGLHGFTEFNNSQSKQASTNHAPSPAPATHW